VTLTEELDNLRQADKHIAEATRRIDAQQAFAASLPAGSSEKARSDALLATMLATRVQFMLHREAIVESIARLRAEEGGHSDRAA
jgi:hypothetical protein